MSLIPSESYSFPDHFSTTITPSRKPKEKPAPKVVVELPRQKNTVVPMPRPQAPIRQQMNGNGQSPPRQQAPVRAQAPIRPQSNGNGQAPQNRFAAEVMKKPVRREMPVRPSAPQPVIKKIPLPPSLKPKVRWNNRAPVAQPPPPNQFQNGDVDVLPPTAPVQNVIPIRPLPKAPRPPQMPRPEIAVAPMPAPVLPVKKPVPTAKVPRPPVAQPKPVQPRPAISPEPQADFFEMFAESGETVAIKHRRKMKMRRFIACEAIVGAVLLPSALLGLSRTFSNPALVWSLDIITIAAAVAAAIIPIMFFAFTPTLPERDR